MGTNEETNSMDAQKILKFSIIGTAALSVVILLLLVFFMYQDSLAMKIDIDGVTYKVSQQDVKIDDKVYTIGTIDYVDKNKNEKVPMNLIAIGDNGVLYFSIENVAKIQGYDFTLGEYLQNTMTTDACHVHFDGGEDVTFKAGSKDIYKILDDDINNQGGDVEVSAELLNARKENYTLKDTVVNIDGNLYTSAEGIMIGYNSTVEMEGNKITLNSLENLYEITNNLIAENGYASSVVYKNKRAIPKGVAVVSKAQESSSGMKKFGLYSIYNGKNITDMRYDTIDYLSNIDRYIVSSDGNYGILQIKDENGRFIAKETMTLQYENIELIDAEQMLFMIKKQGKFGVVNDENKEIVPPECTSIGIKGIEKFENQNIENPYLLFGKIIPVEKNGQYAFFTLDGVNRIPGWNHYGYGCTETENISNPSAEPVLIIPESAGLGSDYIVFRRENGYSIASLDGASPIPAINQSIYSVTNNGVTTYYRKDMYGKESLLKDAFSNLPSN